MLTVIFTHQKKIFIRNLSPVHKLSLQNIPKLSKIPVPITDFPLENFS